MYHRLRQWWHCRKHKQDYEEKWPELPVYHLVVYDDDPEEGAIIVFIDWAGDLDWYRDDKAVAYTKAKGQECHSSDVLNEIAYLESRVANWPFDLRVAVKRMLGEAIARVFRCDRERAIAALDATRSFLRQKSREVSRYWTLQACVLAAAFISVLGVFTLTRASWITALVGQTPYLLFLAFCCGAVGALFSLILRLGKLGIDASAERRLHFAEGFARIIAGGIAGVVVGATVKLGIILPVFSQNGLTGTAICAAAILGGASERWVPSMIASVENNEHLSVKSGNK